MKILLRASLIIFFYLWQMLSDITIAAHIHAEPRYFMFGVMDTLLVVLLPFFGRNNLIYDLQRINTAAVLLHFYGMILYIVGLPPINYNLLITLLSAFQLMRILWISPNDGNYNNVFEFDFRRGRFYSFASDMQNKLNKGRN